MTFRSRNWETLIATQDNFRVAYTTSSVVTKYLEVTQVPTVVVSIIDDDKRRVFIGVSRCSPNDIHNKKLGREIAAGRALKMWWEQGSALEGSYPMVEIDEGSSYELVAASTTDIELFCDKFLDNDESLDFVAQ